MNSGLELWAIAEGWMPSPSNPAAIGAGLQAAPREWVGDTVPANGIVTIPVTGVLTKAPGWWAGTSSALLARTLRQLAAEPRVKGVVLAIDSPGGTVAGTQDAADAVAALAAVKPTVAVIEDLGASAAYWIASQARNVFAVNPTTIVGSIGTYFVVYDWSKYVSDLGVKAIKIATGPHKGAGAIGTKIEDEHVAKWQSLVDAMQTHFSAAVAKGRKLSAEAVAALATGEVWTADRAVGLKLIDGIRTLPDAVRQLAEEVRMSAETKAEAGPAKPVAATIAELKTAFPEAGADFWLAQVEKGATLASAKEAWLDAKAKALEAKEKALAEQEAKLKADAAKPKADDKPLAGKGAKPLEDKPAAGGQSDAVGDPGKAFKAKVLEYQRERKCDRQTAALAVARDFPELQQAAAAMR